MKKLDMAIGAGVVLALIAFFLNMAEEGYLKFVDLRPIAETQLAKVLEGDTQDCLTVPTQTNRVSIDLAIKLEGKTTRQVLKELPEYYCEGKRGATTYIKYLTDSTKPLYILLDKSLDEPIRYDFNPPEATSPATTTEAGRSTTNRSIQLPREAQNKNNPLQKR